MRAIQEIVQVRVIPRWLERLQFGNGAACEPDPAVRVPLRILATWNDQREFGRQEVDARVLPNFDAQAVVQLRFFRYPVFALPFQDLA